jgi:hypothetical protein
MAEGIECIGHDSGKRDQHIEKAIFDSEGKNHDCPESKQYSKWDQRKGCWGNGKGEETIKQGACPGNYAEFNSEMRQNFQRTYQ